MPALKDLVNNLSNFKYYSGVGTFSANKVPYGRDTVTGGDSGQPYVVSTPNDVNILGTGAILKDVKRISSFLADKSKGVEFTLKQVGLQLMNPQLENRTRVPDKDRKTKGVINKVGNFLEDTSNRILNDVGPTRIYNPLNTNLLAQVAGSALSTHIVRHGLTLEVREEDKYTSIVRDLNEKNGSRDNRLVSLTNRFASSPLKGGDIISEYTGGPNSFLGIGKTTIKRVEGLNTFTDFRFNKEGLNGFVPIVTSDIFNINKEGYLDNSVTSGEGLKTNTEKSFDFRNNDFRAYKKLQNPSAYDGNSKTVYIDTTVEEGVNNEKFNTRITDYSKYNKYDRIGVINSNSKRFNPRRHDGVNMVGLYRGTGGNGLDAKFKFDVNGAEVTGKNIRDLIKFRIKSLNNDKPGDGVFMVFRAFFNGAITDSIDANWKPITYAGRGESFYGYEGTTANMTFSFTIMGFSRAEMKPLYQKLNYLKSTLYPDYKANRMRGNLSELTIGDYIKYQPGIITGMTITIPEDANWEIAMNEPDNVLGNLDADMHELPMMVRVDMNFIPIYNFLPRKSADAPFIGIDDELESLAVNNNGTINRAQTNLNRAASPKEWVYNNDAKLK